MARRSDKRMRLIVAANRLFHRNGYERSSIGDIADEAHVPPGNVYYHFKTKEELAGAVIENRNAFITAWLDDITAREEPGQALIAFVDEFEKTARSRAAHGCPIGGLAQEANRIGGTIAKEAGGAFAILLDWLQDQFTGLGEEPEAARASAAHVLACLQGASLLAQTFQDPKLVEVEAGRLKDWLRGWPVGGR